MESEHPHYSTSEKVIDNPIGYPVSSEMMMAMSKIIRHDIRNKLAIIMGYQDITRMKLAKGEDVEIYLDGIKKNCLKILSILDINRDFEKLGTEDKVSQNVSSCFYRAAEFFNLSEIEVQCACGNLEVLADSLLIRLFYHLIDNSLKHGETLSNIKLYNEGDYRLIYEDDGGGIPDDKRANIYNHSLEHAGVHGLTLINKIIESYNWTLTEEGKPQAGVRFVIDLPKNTRRRLKN